MKVSKILFFACYSTLIVAAAPQQNPPAGQKQPDAPVISGADTPATDTTKTPIPTSKVPTVPENPDAITVIKQLNPIPSEKTMELSAAIKLLSDKRDYAKGVQKLIETLSYDMAIKNDESEWTTKDGPHLLIHDLDPGTYDTKTESLRGWRSKWYIYRKGIGFDEYAGTRLFGISTIYLLSIVGPADEVTMANMPQTEYTAVVKKKLPANVQDALGLLTLAGYSPSQAKVLSPPTYLYGFGLLDKIDLPSDITVGAYIPDIMKDRTQLHPMGTTVTLDDEGLYRWDVGVGYPVSKVKDLQYTQTGNTIQTAQVDKSTMLAIGNLFLWPVDIKNPGSSFHPSLFGGVGLQGKVRERMVAGIATNLPPIHGLKFTKSGWYQFLQPYVGVEFLSTSRLVSNPAPGAPSSELHTVRKLAFGLEIPVKATIQRLANAKKAQSTATASDPSASTATPPAKKAAPK